MYKLSRAAARDIEIILERSIIDFGFKQTDLYSISLEKCLNLINKNPNMGAGAGDIHPDYRRFRHSSHVIFYRIIDNDVFIIRILHKSMDIDRHISK